MSNSDNQNPNRAPWTSGGSGDPTNSDPFSAANRSDPYSPNDSSSAAPLRKSRLGCWFWGCLGTLVFGLIAMIGIGFGGYWLLTSQVAKYTDTQPAEIPVVEYEEEKLNELEARIEAFTNQVKGDDPNSEAATEGELDDGDESLTESPADTDDLGTEPDDQTTDGETTAQTITELVLSAEELNALISNEEQLKGRVFVRIEEGRVLGQISVPTDMFPGGKGRFLNADGEFDVSMEDGILVVRLTDASVKGQAIPTSVMEGFANENLAKDAYNDPKNAEMLRKFESIQVVDDKLVLKLREPEADE